MNYENISQAANSLARKARTRNPFMAADHLGIEVLRRPIGGVKGFYTICKKQPYNFINSRMHPVLQDVV